MSDLEVLKEVEKRISEELKPCPADKYIFGWNSKNIYLLNANQQVIGLNLSDNNLSELTVLKALPNLTMLNLSYNQLSDLTVLKALPNLAALNLSHNNLSDITVLNALPNLASLNLSRNQLSDLTVLKALPNLTALDLSGNRLSDITVLKALPNLTALNLSHNNLSDLTVLKALPNLTTLNLGGNQLNDISVLKELKNLTRLNLWGNELDDISVLKKLKKLTALSLAGNKIKDIEVLKDLNNISNLCLGDNQLKILPEWLLGFNLNIKLNSNGGTTIESSENVIHIENNPLEEPPIEIARLEDKAIRAYFNGGERNAINEVKIILIGSGGAGKTSLSKVLRGKLFDRYESQTHGINIDNQQIKGINVNFWDFGGHEMQHATHQFFLSKRCLYILVLNSRTEDKEDNAEYWLKYIESFGGNSPILVVLNKIDDNPSFDVNRKSLKEKYQGIQGFYKISCENKNGLDKLKEKLCETFAKVPLIRSKLPKTWFTVKKHLEDLPQQKNFIDYQAFRDLCTEQQITDSATQDVLSQYLNDLGVIIHFTDPQLMGTPVLKPRWITQAVYKIINFKLVAEAHGVFNLSDLPIALAKKTDEDFDYPQEKYNHIIELMKKFEICYELNKEQILIPDLLEIQEPEFEFNDNEALRFRIRYDFLSRLIMPRFIVKRHLDIEDKLRWRTGVVLEDKNLATRAVVKVDYQDKFIDIVVNGTQKRDFFAVIRKTFNEIHAGFDKEKFEVNEVIPLPNNTNYEVEYAELIGYEKARKDDYFVGKLGKSYSVSELLNGIEKPENRESVNHKTVINYGHYHEDSQMSNERTINAINYVEGSNNGNIAGRDIIQTQTNENGDMKLLLAELLKQIEELKSKTTTENESMLVQINRDAETLASEINSDTPRKQWCDLSLDSIKTTAQKIGDIALPIINVVEKFSQLPSF